jgi:MFS family permease
MAQFPLNPTQKGFVVAILELGCWAGAWIAGFFADKIGRKFTIVLGTVIFLLGASLVCNSIQFLLGFLLRAHHNATEKSFETVCHHAYHISH